MISVSGVSKTYGKIKALNNISFNVNSGEILGYLGPNGSGKTTTINIISGLILPDSGSVKILGNDVNYQYGNLKNHIGVVFEEHGLYPHLTAEENIEFFARIVGLAPSIRSQKVNETLALVELEDRKKSLVKTYSKGMLRRLSIARSIIQNPKILILDEPFDGIDIESRRAILNIFKKWIEEPEHCILMTSHNMADIESICNKIIILNSGNLILEDNIMSFRTSGSTVCYNVMLTKVITESSLRDILKDIPEIYNIEIDGSKAILKSNDSILSSRIANNLIKSDIAFAEIRISSESLEDAYLRLVNSK